MADYVAGDSSTTASVIVGSYVDGAIETATDHDWYRVSLTAGQTYVFATNSLNGSDVDTVLTLRSPGAGAVQLASDDDGGVGLFSRLTYTASASGIFYLDVGTYGGETGSFRLSAALGAPPTPDAVAGNSSTTASLALGGSVNGTIDTAGDHDWYRVALTAGQTYVFRTVAVGSSDVDTTLALRNGAGTQLAYNDDSGSDGYSRISFTPTSSGTYYVDVGGYEDNDLGVFRLVMEQGTPLPLYSNDDIARQLTTGYWAGSQHHFAVTAGGVLSYTISGLTSAGQTLAREAFNLWSDATGIRFQEVATGGQIVIDDASSGANTRSAYSGGISSSATINIGTDWLATNGTSFFSYSMQTYIHEIGHALGLGHAGNYNNDASYDTDALYRNDSWATTVMSYFDERENDYFQSLGFTRQYALTPMVADAVATTSLYGTATATRTGDTVYGFHNTSGRLVYDAAANPAGGYTIFDNGGTDTLDYSGFGQAQTINLNAEAFSNIGAGIGNVTIARGAVIENAIGGSGADTIIGNAVANTLSGGSGNDVLTGGGGADILTGGDGNDVFTGTLADMNGDRITDFTRGDHLLMTDYASRGGSYTFANSLLRVGGQSITLTGFSGQFAVHVGSDGGGSFFATGTGGSDFTGDGHTDILWRNANGSVSMWTVSGNVRGDQVQQAAFSASVVTSWSIVETFDRNGDGRSDILWRNSNGEVAVWDARAGGFNQASYGHAAVGTDWRIAGAGDLNGDGKDDILWQNRDGSLSAWTSTGTGFVEASYTHASVGQSWKVEGVGDFNGDGRADILWRNDNGTLATWLNNSQGAAPSFTDGGYVANGVPTSWHIDGVGDFNGDGRDDLLWRNDNGAVSIWRSNGAGFDQAAYNTNIDTSWHIAEVGDLNDDGKADLVWRNDNGAVSTWQSNGTDFDQAIYNSTAATSWTIAAHDYIL